jgi:N-acetylglucosaminyldiphosphoundecaprenol N-acetyl-beta-D-mannosaminyltransferase
MGTTLKESKPMEFQGIRFSALSLEELVALVDKNISGRREYLKIVNVNVAVFAYAQKNRKLREAINNADIVNVDGSGIGLALRLLGYKNVRRIPGPDIFERLLQLAAQKGYQPYLFGATQEVVEKTALVLQRQYPGLTLAGSRNGFYKQTDEAGIAEAIGKSGADMLFLAFLTPQKELFADMYCDRLKVPVSFGVGGAFDIVAGKTKRAPRWVQKYGIEFLYRFIQEPQRLWKRYLTTNALLVYYALKEILKRKLMSGSP